MSYIRSLFKEVPRFEKKSVKVTDGERSMIKTIDELFPQIERLRC
jgi:hypothetical protein